MKTRERVLISTCVPGVSLGGGAIQMEIFGLGDIKVVPSVFSLRDGANNPLYLEDTFGNFARVITVFNEEKIQE